MKSQMEFKPVKKVEEPTSEWEIVEKTPIRANTGRAGGKSEWAAVDRPDPTRMEWSDAFRSAVSNLGGSGWQFAKDVTTPILHPIDTVKAMGSLAAGTAEKLIPGDQGHEQSFDAMVDFMRDRYGSVENFKQTVAKDPVGVLGDVASLFMAGGGAVRGLGAASKVKALQAAGQAATRAGAMFEPVSLVKSAAGAGAKLIPDAIPEKLYQSAAKFSTVAGKGKPGMTTKDVRQMLTRTALENEIMPTYRGLEKIRDKVSSLNNEITGMIERAETSGARIPVQKLFKGFQELELERLKTSGKPISEVKEIRRIRKQIEDANTLIGRSELTPMEAQKLKQTIYSDLEKYYEKTAQNPASVKAQKAVARAAKESLEEIMPEIKFLNKKEGALLELKDAIDRAAARISNRDILGIGIPIKGGAGAALGTVAGDAATGGTLGLLWGVVDSPGVKSKLAIVIDKLKRQGVSVQPTRAAVELGLFQTGRMEGL
jgi:hypothetical protein